MPGGQYIALSGLRARMDEFDRVAADISNTGTPGYKGERQSHNAVSRDSFSNVLDTAIDSTMGARRIDLAEGTMASTGRALDVAVNGPGFFVVQTADGDRYTRNGHFLRSLDGTLVTSDGATVQGADGPITLGPGEVKVQEDGSVYAGKEKAGQLALVTFDDTTKLTRGHGATLRADGQIPTPIDKPAVRGESLEESNVAVSERLAQLTDLARSFEAMQKAISTLMNDVDGRAIDSLGRR